jgi:23S rRNA (cytidine1920-2'-O)/16S rRNA (cytidine1409-2'-O)-methyltransferase
MPKRRIDALLAERGMAPSRTGAAESVRAGRVRIGRDGPLARKPSELVAEDAELVVTEPPPFVSRGGIKLENALEAFAIDVAGMRCLDVGASTGGFTDCLLKRGAARVIALDVAHGQLDWGLRNDPRVEVIERRNARELDPDELPFAADLATIDVAFISVSKVLGAVAACVGEDGELLVLVKPQFELGRDRVGKGGVVRDPAARRDALRAVAASAADAGLAVRGFASSGLPGPKGNRETFIRLSKARPAGDPTAPGREAEEAGGIDVDAAVAEVEP